VSRADTNVHGAPVLNLVALLREISTVAQVGGPAARCEALVRETESFADMVGWATGPIDPHGQLLDRLASLQDDLRIQYDRDPEPALALLHDALTDLGRAIAQHDQDVDRNRPEDKDPDID